MKVSRRKFAKASALVLVGAVRPTRSDAADQQLVSNSLEIANAEFASPIVVPENPSKIIGYAADELAYHVERATGQRPKIMTESAVTATLARPAIYLGDTQFARKMAIPAGPQHPEASLIQTIDGNICIVGGDGGGDPLDLNTPAGTLFGVYDFLERFVGVRWLWPGELGTFIPLTKSISVPPGTYPSAPRFKQRHVRTAANLKSADHPELGFSPQAETDYFKAQSVFLRRHRMGRPQYAKYGHAFGKWWDKYQATHPEWFQLVNNKRGPVKKGARYSMCISDPNFHAEVVSQWRKQNADHDKSLPLFINAVENDIPGLCECNVCTGLDAPESADYRSILSPTSRIADLPFVTDRYVKSWLAIQKLAAAENPNATVVGYAYFNYFAPPTSGVKLNHNIVIGFCPSGLYFPHSDKEHEWLKLKWREWAETGAQIFMRANYFLDGYCMPYIFAHQFADEFKNAAQKNMFGTDFDSLTGHWATQGPNLYALMRLHAHPEMTVDAVLAEYYASFGPAAADVQSYFAYWETFTTENRAHVKDAFEALDATRWRSWAKAAHATYDASSFQAGEALLDKAKSSAGANREALDRINFLQLGLQHAKLCAEAASKLTMASTTSSYERGKERLEDLLEFRRTHERKWISNFNHCGWVESKSWTLPPVSSQGEDTDQD